MNCDQFLNHLNTAQLRIAELFRDPIRAPEQREQLSDAVFTELRTAFMELRIAQNTGSLSALCEVINPMQAEMAQRQQQAVIELLHAITIASNEATSIEQAVQTTLDLICAHIKWPVAHTYVLDHDTQRLRSASIWHLEQPESYTTLQAITAHMTFAHGYGLPGQVWATRQPIWITDAQHNLECGRLSQAGEVQINSAFAFPVMVKNDVVAVLEFFTPHMLMPDEFLLQTVRQIGTQLGRVFERQRTEEHIRRMNADLEQRVALRTIQLEQLVAEFLREQQRLQEILATIPGIVWELRNDTENRDQYDLTFVSNFAEKLLGYSIDEWMATPQFWTQILHPDHYKNASQTLNTAYLTGSSTSYEYCVIAKDGRNLWLEEHVTPIWDDIGRLIGMRGVSMESTRRKQIESELHKALEHLQMLNRKLIDVQEQERRYLARELHDEIGQGLTAFKISLQVAQRTTSNQPMIQAINNTIAMIDQMIDQVRNLARQLRPSVLDDLGLVAALRWHFDRIQQHGGPEIHFVADSIKSRLPAQLETTCFRIAQEALTNILRHAQAQHVQVTLHQDAKTLWLTICDDGSGFDVAPVIERSVRGEQMGLLGMQERAHLLGGTLTITSAPGSGTTITASFLLFI